MNCRLERIITTALVIFCFASVPAYAASDPDRFDKLQETEWYGVYMQGAKIGYASTSLNKIGAPVSGWRIDSEFILIANVMGKTDTLITRDSRLFQSPGGELYSSKLVIYAGGGEISVEGKKEADEFIVETSVAGQSSIKAFPYPADYLDNLAFLRQYISSGKAAVGDSLNFSIFEPTPPMTGTMRQAAKITSKDVFIFNGVATDVYTVDWTILEANIPGRTILDMEGRELEVTLGGGLLMKLETESLAKTLDSSYDLLAENLIFPNKKIDNPENLSLLKLEISGIDESDILKLKSQSVIKNDSQNLSVVIKRPVLPDKILGLPIQSSRLKPFLDPEPYIQSDAEEIASLAREIMGGETNSWETARKINTWVFENIEKQFTPEISNALQTLHSKRGDCGEHAALAVALMRAAGIPARPVTGLVYWPPGDGFGYHAWIEVFVGEWMMMDPSWGEDIINPSHIALTAGDLLDQISVLTRVIGRMKIEVTEAR